MKRFQLILAVFVILLLMMQSLLYSQGGFKKKYFLQNSLYSVSRDVFESPNGNLILSGYTSDTINNKAFSRLSIMGTNSQGDFIWQKNYGRPGFQYINNILQSQGGTIRESNCFYQVICVKDSTSAQMGALIKFNYSGDTLWQKIYKETSPKDIIPQGISKSVDGGFLITGVSQNIGAQACCLLLKTDINGNELWRKRITKSIPDIQDGKSVVQDSATKKIIIVGYQYIGNPSSTYGNVLILDSLGNKLLQTTFNNADGGAFGQVIQLQDKSLLTGGAWWVNEIGNVPYFKAFLVKFNILGNVIWTKQYSVTAPVNGIGYLDELPNKEIVMLGRSDTSTNITPQIFRIDSLGNLKWLKNIGGNHGMGSFEGTKSMSRLLDGGFIISTWYPYKSGNHPYSIIKIDSTGCDTTEQWCMSVALGNDKLAMLNAKWAMYPNPANEILNFELAVPNGSFGRSTIIKISDISGRELENLEMETEILLQLNTSEYKSGVYFVSILIEGKAIETRKLVIVR